MLEFSSRLMQNFSQEGDLNRKLAHARGAWEWGFGPLEVLGEGLPKSD